MGVGSSCTLSSCKSLAFACEKKNRAAPDDAHERSSDKGGGNSSDGGDKEREAKTADRKSGKYRAHREPVHALAVIRQHDLTCSALSASNPWARSSIFSTLSSLILLKTMR